MKNIGIKRRLGILLATLGLILGSVLFATPAQAYTKLCGNYGDTPSFSCVAFSGFSGQRPWGYPADSSGHNCTNYASYRLWKNNVGNPGNLGNAKDWDNKASAYGLSVNTTPAVGSIAQWEANVAPAGSSGHVAYVDAVTSSYIDVSEDNYGGTTMTKRFFVGQAGWPSHFIHFGGNTGATNGGVSSPGFQGVGSAVLAGGSARTTGQHLGSNQYIVSPNGWFALVMQTDGNLVEYSGGNGAIWNSGTGGNPGAHLVMQHDGNMVIYNSTQTVALWQSNTRSVASLWLQDDGNVVGYNSSSQAQWSTGTQRVVALTYQATTSLSMVNSFMEDSS